MKNQTVFRGGDNKKEKLTKMEKVYNALKKSQRQTLSVSPKKEVLK